ncbi:MAG: hypothetical protein Q8880_00370 [Bacteroidota bacterium]|nr:hypothetical protein [Bacteroidota bacterium]
MSSNPSAGQTYSNVINGDTITETVMGSEKITVAAGTFTCWKIKEVHSYNGSTAYAWIDKDAGVIKESATISSSYYTSSTIMELKSKNF